MTEIVLMYYSNIMKEDNMKSQLRQLIWIRVFQNER